MRLSTCLVMSCLLLCLGACGEAVSEEEALLAKLREGMLVKREPQKDKRMGSRLPDVPVITSLAPRLTGEEVDRVIAALARKAELTELDFKLGSQDDEDLPTMTIKAPPGTRCTGGIIAVSFEGNRFHATVETEVSGFADKKAEYDEFENRTVLVDTPDLFLVRLDLAWRHESLFCFVLRVPFGVGECLAMSDGALRFDDNKPNLEDVLLTIHCLRTMTVKGAPADDGAAKDPEAVLTQLGWSMYRDDEGRIHSVSVYPGVASDSALPYVAQLKDLRTLDLNAVFTEQGLSHLAGMTQLTGLELDLRQATPAVLALLKNMRAMKSLTIAAEHFFDDSLAAISDMSQLESLTLGPLLEVKTPLKGPGLVHLANKPALSYLSLRMQAIDDESLLHLPELPGLKTLDLSGNPITGRTLAKLKLPLLESLELDNTRVSDLSGLAAFPRLTSLKLYNTRVRDKSLPALANLSNLNWLKMHALPISDKGATELAKIQSLRTIELSETSIHDEGFALLCTLPNLYALKVNDSPLTDKVFDALRQAPQIQYVELYTTRITQEALEQFRKDRPEVSVKTSFPQ